MSKLSSLPISVQDILKRVNFDLNTVEKVTPYGLIKLFITYTVPQDVLEELLDDRDFSDCLLHNENSWTNY
jgi:hypothetical protein